MCADFYHKPVMLEEVLKWLCVNKNGIYVDGTVGGA
ncbi:MAG: 16S rRNA (cytosine(1402)-N(4))-methyltransferase, partial [Syntrophaceae bacterium]|nr:16S rRNA (cytosine(1402)-N(4))-methyltransferase [Syntrophaceae bacterium]